MSPTAPKLEWRGVSKRFDDQGVLDGLNLSVAPGRSLVIIGASGQGKSVAIKIAIGLLQPDAGAVLVDGADLTRMGGGVRRRLYARFGMLFQSAALFDSLSVWENVAFRLINADGVGRKAARVRALEALDQVRLSAQVADRFPSELSGGMQKRVGLARAIVARPEIIMFDEPTTGLDPITAAAIDELIIEQVKGLGCTAISITHDLASARRIGDDIALLHGGKIQWLGPAGEIDRSGNPYVEQFIAGRSEGPITAAL
jgi:phospholipid/cholesterol/gamma-HCH transport system ATP-binding protein